MLDKVIQGCYYFKALKKAIIIKIIDGNIVAKLKKEKRVIFCFLVLDPLQRGGFFYFLSHALAGETKNKPRRSGVKQLN